MESITILMDAVSLSNISLGSEVLESLPSSPDVHKHDDEGIENRDAIERSKKERHRNPYHRNRERTQVSEAQR